MFGWCISHFFAKVKTISNEYRNFSFSLSILFSCVLPLQLHTSVEFFNLNSNGIFCGRIYIHNGMLAYHGYICSFLCICKWLLLWIFHYGVSVSRCSMWSQRYRCHSCCVVNIVPLLPVYSFPRYTVFIKFKSEIT